MTYRLLLDENVEHEVRHRLENYGHDVEHVDYVPALGKGAPDTSIGEFSLQENRVVVTYDDDFVTSVGGDQFRAVVYSTTYRCLRWNWRTSCTRFRTLPTGGTAGRRVRRP